MNAYNHTANFNDTHIIILAGGKGRRMNNTDTPKVLCMLNNKPLIQYLLNTVQRFCPKPSIIIGYRGNEIVAATQNYYHYIWQYEQLGTGHAVMCAKRELERRNYKHIVVINGDHPFISAQTLTSIISTQKKRHAPVVMATVTVPHFRGIYEPFYHYGRVIRDIKGNVLKIVECKDATSVQRLIAETNINLYCFDAIWLWKHILHLNDHNAQKEYYITDMVQVAHRQGGNILAIPCPHYIEGLGVNTPEQLALLEDLIALRKGS